jgi:hypothetical protein
MNRWIIGAFLFALGCGESKPPPPPTPPPPAAKKEPEFKSDPKGKYACLMCNLKTSEENCPKCKMSLKPKEVEAPKPAAASTAPGKTAVAPKFVCPKPDCRFDSAGKGKCLTHADTEMVEQWYACAKCSVKEPVAGKCPKCSGDLKGTVK